MSTAPDNLPDALIAALHDEIAAADLVSNPETAADAIEAARVDWLGRKSGRVTALFGRMKDVAPEGRRAFGQQLNGLKQAAEAKLAEAQDALKATEQAAGALDAKGRRLDLTLPGRFPAPHGSIHPLTQTRMEIEAIFAGFGFGVAEGPEIEDDWHNFSALNFGPEHPARDMQDTFFVDAPPPNGPGTVLRTHTSPVQVRVMEHAVTKGTGPPIRMIAPGRVFRNERITYKSYCLFHQVEGLVVDESVTFADLKEILVRFAEALFGGDVRMRFRPSFFPFTEPSAEVDIWWADDSLPGGGRWMEILGCGMVDPNVLTNVGIDAERYTGYAFGMGIERMCMLKHGIGDIRLFYENDVRFLQQF
ncbi:MAG: phenylalanine--tRNA ligase subunit alpha [Bacteroidota bacterium]